MLKKYLPICCFILLLPGVAMAQRNNSRDTIIPGQTIEIIQSYKPEITRQPKPVLYPSLPVIDTSKPVFQYEVPQQTLSYTYHSVPIRPLALGRQEVVIPSQNYVKAGFGNRSTLYLDAGIGSVKTEDYETAFHITHLSQKGPVKNQQTSLTRFDGQGKYLYAGHAFSADLDISRNRSSFYGYDHDDYDFSKSTVKQVYTGALLNLGAENLKSNRWDVWYKPRIGLGLYADKFSAAEREFAFDIPASKTIDSNLTFSLGLKGNFTQLKTDSFNTGNNYIQFNPALDIKWELFKFHIGLSPTWGKDNTAYLLPDISLQAGLFNGSITLNAGWKGKLIQNTYRQLSGKNPFLYNIYDIKQTKSDQVYGGFESILGKHVSFGGVLSWKQWKDMPLFINDYSLSPDGRYFSVVYDRKVEALSLDAFIRYQVGNVFGLGASGTWYNFYHTQTWEKVYHEPMLRLGGNMYIHPVEQLYISVNADFWDGVYAREPDSSARKLPVFLDLSASAEYSVIKRLSLFLQFNNILGVQYQRWNQYQTYGFQVIGGLRFKF